MKIVNCKLEIEKWRGQALPIACLVCLLVAGTARSGAAAERSPQTIPPPTSAHVQQHDANSSSGVSGGKSSNGGKSKPVGSSNWGTTLGGLLAVIALILLTAKVLRKSLPAGQRTLPIEVIQVLGRKPLDYRHTIHLVRCGSRLLVLGSSQEGLTTLCEMTDPSEIDYLAGLCKPSEPTSVADSFNQLFRRFQSPQTVTEIEPETHSGSDPALLRLQERLQNARQGESDEADDGELRVDQPGKFERGEAAA